MCPKVEILKTFAGIFIKRESSQPRFLVGFKLTWSSKLCTHQMGSPFYFSSPPVTSYVKAYYLDTPSGMTVVIALTLLQVYDYRVFGAYADAQ